MGSVWATDIVTSSHCERVPAVRRWSHRLTNVGRQGRPTAVSKSDMVQQVEDIILSNHSVSIAHIAQYLGISVGSSQSTGCHQLDYLKLCSRWVIYSLSS
ncbi:hypothetical protein HNY73_001730 [Argiope bruennichi]|uniref:Uncharacterized protein n=1 Tax=Argiope bruennichi TaxID=94029 RepID=A0A8T0FVT8_ARGBR|nr:hypothetical protein HNY73_001730 [Argiope bruennichi]